MTMNAPQKNALHALAALLRLSRVRVTRATLAEKLGQHPDFPSLTALSDTLDELRVDNLAAHLTPDQLPDIPLPALVYLNSAGGFFAPLRAATPAAVEWWHARRGWQTESLSQFSQHWNGVALLVEPTERAGEANYAQSRRRELLAGLRLPFAGLILLLCLGVWAGVYAAPRPGALPYYVLLLLYAAGSAVSGLLVWHTLDADNPFLRSLCQLNARTNCSAVLHSSAAKLLGWLSWSEIGLFYFGGGLLALLFFRANPAPLYPLLFGLTIAALPYTFWSVYYQWRRARQWCVLCLTVQGLLWVQFAAFLSFRPYFAWPVRLHGPAIGLLLTGLLLLPALWALLKPVWAKALRTDGLQQSLQKLKFDEGYLEALRQRARPLPPIFTGMQVPTLGATDAPDTLTVVTNPTCSKCAKAHLEIEQLLAELEDVQCQFILAAARRPHDAGPFVAERVLSQPAEQMTSILHEWYAQPHFKNWLENTAAAPITEAGAEQLELHQRWCELAGVSATPTIFFNGIEIPRYYTMAETKRLLKHFKEGIGQFT